MSVPKSSRPMPVPNEEVIVIQRLETISTIVPGDGDHTMVETAFLAAGQYLDRRVGRDGEADSLQFTYRGWTFHASAVEPAAQNPPVPFPHDYSGN